MTNTITLAVDGMGGDHAPNTVIEGMSKTRELFPEVAFKLFGQESVLRPILKRFDNLVDNCEIIHTDAIVSGDDKPSQVLRHGRKSSMGLAIQSVKDGAADVAISGGNTGGLMALSKFMLRTMPGIDRPALVAPMPTLRGESVLLDLGANIECSAEALVQFAIMGAAYARAVLGLKSPTVGLLNVGEEELKGNEQVKGAAEFLRDAEHLNLDYRGFVEGDGIGKGDVDVIVTDGFTGNIALKTAEGTARLMSTLLGDAFRSSLFTKIGYAFSRSGLQSLRDHLDPNNHNGGMLIGLNGLVVKSHGSANTGGYVSALTTAIDLVRGNLTAAIGADLKRMQEAESALDSDADAGPDDATSAAGKAAE